MIQRIQSVYLLFVTAVMSFLLIRPYAEVGLSDGGSIVFYILSIERFLPGQGFLVYERTFSLLLLTLFSAGIAFINIFLYLRRPVQIRVCYINIVALLILLVLMFINYTRVKNAMSPILSKFVPNVICLSRLSSRSMEITLKRAFAGMWSMTVPFSIALTSSSLSFICMMFRF